MSGLSLARAGSLLGLGIGLGFVWLLAVVHGSEETGLVWGLALGLAYVAPFAVALLAFGLRDRNTRGTTWIGTGGAGFILVFSSLAGVALILFVPAILLVVGGGRELALGGGGRPGVAVTLVAGSVAAALATLVALFAARASVSESLLIIALGIWASLGMWLFVLSRTAGRIHS